MSASLAGDPPLEAEGGAVPLDSRFYVERATDPQFRAAIARRDSIVLVKGARQIGKSSLLARGLDEARRGGARVALTDFQTLSPPHLESAEALCLALGALIAEQLDLDLYPEDLWETGRGANAGFSRYLTRAALEPAEGPLVWGLDEVDRLFTSPFSDEIFAMFRGWHNRRALEPGAPWSKLTLAISFATEAHLFIRDLNQSPFNVGTRVTLHDFTPEQVADLNRRYGSPLRTRGERERFCALLGGHPYLTRCGLHELAAGGLRLETLEKRAESDHGPFGDHLRRIYALLARDPELAAAARRALAGDGGSDSRSLCRLRGAGILTGEPGEAPRFRCELYAGYLRERMG
jgi:hypothetical protein